MKFIKASDKKFVPASHEKTTDPGVWKKVLLTYQDLCRGRIQMLNWAKLPIGKSFQNHYHQDLQEVFIMIYGNAQMEVNSEVLNIGPGDVVIVDPMEKHLMKNMSTKEVEYIVFGITKEGKGKTVVV